MKEKISANLTRIFYGKILKLSKEELRKLIKECEAMTSTNCGWQSYWFKDVFINFAEDRLADLKRIAREKAKK